MKMDSVDGRNCCVFCQVAYLPGAAGCQETFSSSFDEETSWPEDWMRRETVGKVLWQLLQGFQADDNVLQWISEQQAAHFDGRGVVNVSRRLH